MGEDDWLEAAYEERYEPGPPEWDPEMDDGDCDDCGALAGEPCYDDCPR